MSWRNVLLKASAEPCKPHLLMRFMRFIHPMFAPTHQRSLARHWLLFALLPLVIGLSSCGMGEKRYKEAKNDPVSKIDLNASCTKIEKLGDDYRYHFRVTNNEPKDFDGRCDFELIAADLGAYYTETPLEFDVGAKQTVYTYFDTPTAPYSANENGYKYFVFRAYTNDEKLLVRQASDIPEFKPEEE